SRPRRGRPVARRRGDRGRDPAPRPHRRPAGGRVDGEGAGLRGGAAAGHGRPPPRPHRGGLAPGGRAPPPLLVGWPTGRRLASGGGPPLAMVDPPHGHIAAVWLEPVALDPPFVSLIA